MIIYRHYITTGSTETEVFPLNFLETQIVDEKQDTPRRFYRRPFSGTLTFVNNNGGNDFDLLYAIELVAPCDTILFRITRMGDAYWNGQFSTTDGDFDLDNCTFTVTPKLIDDYIDMLDLADIRYNILEVPTIVTTKAFKAGIYDIDYTNNRWLARLADNNVLEYLANYIKPGVTVSSEFFTAADNPATLYTNKLLYLTIAQKSDIKNPDASDPATTAMLSWNELMDILWGIFQVCWDYDSGTDTINVEHISWFAGGVGIDLRTQELCVATNKYNYLKDKMPKYEKWQFIESDDLNFIGAPIWYDSKCVDPDPDSNVKKTTVNVTTDLEYIINYTDSISNEGFVILANYENGGNYYVSLEVGAYDATVVKLNCHLSIANLHNYYFRHNRVLIEGYMNDDLITFWTAQKMKHQKCYAVICPDTGYDPTDEITTELGETYFGGEKATVQRAALKPSGEMDFDLLYGPEDNENTGVETVKAIFVKQEDTCDSLSATLTEAADGALVVQYRENIYDSLDVWQCTGDWETWTIPLGSYDDTFTFATWCQAIPPGGYCVIEIDATALVGWEIYFSYNDNCTL